MIQEMQNALTNLKAVLIAAWTTAASGFSVAVIVDAIQLTGAAIAVLFGALINYALWRKMKAEAEIRENEAKLSEIALHKEIGRRKEDNESS